MPSWVSSGHLPTEIIPANNNRSSLAIELGNTAPAMLGIGDALSDNHSVILNRLGSSLICSGPLARKAVVALCQTPYIRTLATDGAARDAYDENSVAIYSSIGPQILYLKEVQKTFIAYQTSNYDRACVVYDHVLDTFSLPVIVGGSKLTNDGHGNASLVNLPDGRLMIFYGSHATLQHYKISTSAFDVSGWGAEQTVSAITPLTYPQPLNINGTIKLLARNDTGTGSGRSLGLFTWNGSSFGVVTTLVVFPSVWIYALWKLSADGIIHLFWSLRRGYSPYITTGLYYLQSANGGVTWRTGGGTPISLPATAANSEVIVEPDDTWCTAMRSGFVFDSANKPLIIFIRDNRAMFTRLLADSTWLTPREVTSVDSYADSAAILCDTDTDLRAYVTKGPGRGGNLCEYVTHDGGLSWYYSRIICGGQVGMVTCNSPTPDKKIELLIAGPVTHVLTFGGHTPEYEGVSTLNTALVGFYPCNNTPNDFSSYKRHGVETDISYDHGLVGSAASLNGSTSVIAVANPAFSFGASDYSFACWAKLNPVQLSYAGICSKGGSSVNEWGIQRYSTSTDLAIYHGSAFRQFSGKWALLATGSWVHLAVTYVAASKAVTLYINGSPTTVTHIAHPTTGTLPLRLGAARVAGFGMKGLLQDVHFHTRTLSLSEVEYLYNNGIGLGFYSSGAYQEGQAILDC